ncbi:MAG: hypothetical protein GC153_10395 [Alphaproteobacteria bacterium]|nr:hypothetical protein [Alphaproteobacteria bacterium]
MSSNPFVRTASASLAATFTAAVVPTGSALAFSCPTSKHEHVGDAARLAVHHPWKADSNDICVSLDHHQFWVKAVKLKRLDNGNYAGVSYARPSVDPRLSHILSNRPDDQYSYHFEIAPDGKLADFKFSIKRGGVTKVITKSLEAVNFADPAIKALTGVSLAKWTDQDVRKFVSKWGKSAGQKIDGKWEGAAATISLAVASAAARKIEHPSALFCYAPTFFENAHFRGRPLTLKSSASNLHKIKVYNAKMGDRITSLCVPDGWEITAYNDAGFKGPSIKIVGPKEIEDLAKYSMAGDWSDRISSIRVSRH